MATAYTVNVARVNLDTPYDQTHVPGYRHIVDLADLQNSRFIQTTGQSGNVLSSHYDDFIRPHRDVAVLYRWHLAAPRLRAIRSLSNHRLYHSLLAQGCTLGENAVQSTPSNLGTLVMIRIIFRDAEGHVACDLPAEQLLDILRTEHGAVWIDMQTAVDG